jgi:hypothetical protein
MATPRKKHMDTSISADESELFEAPSDIDASPRIKASTESPIPAESKRNPRPASYVKGRYIVPKAPKKDRDEAQKALAAALDQVPDTIHFDRRGKRTTATLYVGNLEFKASTNDLKDALDEEFDEIRVEDVVIPRKDGRSRGYAFVSLSWPKHQRSIHQTSARFIRGSSMSSHDRYTSVSWTARTILHHQMIVFRQNTSTIWIRR